MYLLNEGTLEPLLGPTCTWLTLHLHYLQLLAENTNFFCLSRLQVIISSFSATVFSVTASLISRCGMQCVGLWFFICYLVYWLLEHSSTRQQCRLFCRKNNKAERQCQLFCRPRQLSFSLKRQNLGGAVYEECKGHLKVPVLYTLHAVVVPYNKHQLISGHCLSLNLVIMCTHIYMVYSFSMYAFLGLLNLIRYLSYCSST